jgi:hypothetical protein
MRIFGLTYLASYCGTVLMESLKNLIYLSNLSHNYVIITRQDHVGRFQLQLPWKAPISCMLGGMSTLWTSVRRNWFSAATKHTAFLTQMAAMEGTPTM